MNRFFKKVTEFTNGKRVSDSDSLAALNSTPNPEKRSVSYVKDEKADYKYNGVEWKKVNKPLWIGLCYGCTAVASAGIALAIALPIALAKPAPEPVKYIVNFVTDGGTAMEAVEVEKDALLSVTNPSKEQYLFSDWYKDEALTQRFVPASDKVESNLTLFAEWVPNLKYELNDAGTEWRIGDSNGFDYFNGRELVLPERYQGKPVSGIKGYAFSNSNPNDHYYSKVVIPSSYKSMGFGVFSHICSINYIEFKPNSITEIPDNTFYWGLDKNTTVVIPKSVTTIGEGAFNLVDGSIGAIYYGGTEDDWNAITINQHNDGLTQAVSYGALCFFTENGRNETAVGNWWYYEADGSIQPYYVF